MSSLDYLADLVEKANQRGYVIIKDRCRHTTHTRCRNEPAEKKARGVHNKISLHDEEEILRFNDTGFSLGEIVVATGRAKSTVWRALKKHGRV